MVRVREEDDGERKGERENKEMKETAEKESKG